MAWDCAAGAGAVHGTSWELEEVRGNAVKTMLTLAAISTVASLQVRLHQAVIALRLSAAMPPCSVLHQAAVVSMQGSIS